MKAMHRALYAGVAIVGLLGSGCGDQAAQTVGDGPGSRLGTVVSELVIPSGAEFAPKVKWGGRIQATAIDPSNPNTVLAASDNGGLWQSTDGASNWQRFTSLPPTELMDVVVCPTNTQRIFVSALQNSRQRTAPGATTQANDGGIWRSDDGGVTWVRPNNHAPVANAAYGALGISFGPSCTNVFIGTTSGLAISSDGGTNFTHNTSIGRVTAVVAQAGPGGSIIVDTHGSDGHHRSTNGGSTWSASVPASGPIATAVGLPGSAFTSTHSIAASPNESNVLFATTCDTATVDTNADGTPDTVQVPCNRWMIFESDNGGQSWQQLAPNANTTNRIPFVRTSLPRNGAGIDVYFGDGAIYQRKTCTGTPGLRCAGAWESINIDSRAGFNDGTGLKDCFNDQTVQCTHADPADMEFDPTNNCPLYVASDGGVLKAHPLNPANPVATCGDLGTWIVERGSGPSAGSFNALQLYQVIGQVHPGATPLPTDLYFGTQDNDIWASIDSGANWPGVQHFEGFGFQIAHSTPDRTNSRFTGFWCGSCNNFQGTPGFASISGWNNPNVYAACPDENTDNLCDACANRQASGQCDNVGPVADPRACFDTDSNGVCDGINCVDADRSTQCDPLIGTLANAPVLLSGNNYIQWDNGYRPRNPMASIVVPQLWLTGNAGGNWSAVPGVVFPATLPSNDSVYDQARVSTPVGGLPTLYQPVSRNNGASYGLLRITGLLSGGPVVVTPVDIAGGSLGLTFDGVTALAVNSVDPSKLIGLDAANGRFRVSSDFGANWSPANDAGTAQLTRIVTRNNEFGLSITGMEWDKGNPQRLLVGTDNAGIAYSNDAGSSWARLCKTEQINRASSFFFDEVEQNTYASSYGRGLWKLDVNQRQVPEFTTPPVSKTVNDCRVDIGQAVAADTCEGLPVTVVPDPNAAPGSPTFGCQNPAIRPCGNFPQGSTTTITWVATDSIGDKSTATSTITVGSDLTGPVFSSIPPDLTTTSCTGVNLGQAFAADSCGGSVTITNNAPSTYPLGVTTVTWTARDQRGNTTTATQRVTVLLGDNPACCPAGTNIILGTSNNDTLNGTPNSDCILGRGAQDTINGNGGNDFISGGDGNDVITGGLGNDVIFAGSGQDTVDGNDGADILFGGDGDDTLRGGIGDDTLNGGQGQDTLQGQDGNDQLFGDTGDDNLQGGNGNDNLSGGPNGPGNDTCNGGAGTNTFAQCELGGNADTCADGVKDGTESGVDCGGGCRACAVGGQCTFSSDCLSNVCSANVCQLLVGGIGVVPVVETDWGGGYCVHLDVTNVEDVATLNWSASLNTNQSTIFSSWNGAFSGTSGAITITPNTAGNITIDPNETDGTIGFCANRNVSTSGLLPFVTAASASF
jgi:hypothetical protein